MEKKTQSRIAALIAFAMAILFSAAGFFLLFRHLDLVFQFVPFHTSGPDGDAMEKGFDVFAGVIASLIAFAFAMSAHQGWGGKASKFLIIWCVLLLLGIILTGDL